MKRKASYRPKMNPVLIEAAMPTPFNPYAPAPGEKPQPQQPNGYTYTGPQRNPNDIQIGTATIGGMYYSPSQQPQLPQVDTSNPIGSIAEILGPTPAEREARERRAMESKAKMASWAGLFDGLRQFGNLYSVYKGSTPQQLSSPYQTINDEVNQQRAIADANDNYRRQYAQSLYNLRRQMNQDQMQRETHKAQLDWYKNRDEQNARKVDIQQFKAEADAAYKEATLEQKEKILDIRRQVADNLISYREGQLEIARIRANKAGGSGGGGRSNAGTTKTTTVDYDENGNKRTTVVTTPNTSTRKRGGGNQGKLLPVEGKRGSLLPQ